MSIGRALLCGICVSLVGCGAGTSSTTAAIPSAPTSDYASLAQTIFMGDVVTQYWPSATSAAHLVLVSNGTAFDFEETYGSECISGCAPAALQTDAPGMKRLVILVGEFDALQLCFGNTINNPSDNFTPDLDGLVRSAQSLYGLEVWLGTVPPIYNSSGTQICVTQTSSINQQIVAIGAQENAKVLDFASVVNSSADINLTLQYAGQGAGQQPIVMYPNTYYLPNSTGFAAMTALYDQKNQ